MHKSFKAENRISKNFETAIESHKKLGDEQRPVAYKECIEVFKSVISVRDPYSKLEKLSEVATAIKESVHRYTVK